MGTPELGDRLVWGKWGTLASLWGGFPAVSPQFPPCMKPAACGCACANPGPGCCFSLCPSSSSCSSSSLLCGGLPRPCGAVQGYGSISPLVWRSCWARSGDILGCAGWEPLKPFPALWGVPTGDPGGFGMWAPGKGLPSFLSPPLPASLRPSPIPMRVTPVSLFPLFPLYACAC